jgi:glycosyltransferase involved in cell wall biosynthesis
LEKCRHRTSRRCGAYLRGVEILIKIKIKIMIMIIGSVAPCSMALPAGSSRGAAEGTWNVSRSGVASRGMADPIRHVAFVCPRFAEGATVGGAETLLKALALRCVRAGLKVDFLTTCATNHFTWENTVAPGAREVDGMTVRFFPVDADRDVGTFLRVQDAMGKGIRVSDEDERAWIAASVNSRALIEHLRTAGAAYDRILMGPYLFGVVFFASQVHPDRTLLVPCLHDEAFAYLGIMREMFGRARGYLFNTAPERDLARRLYDVPEAKCAVVGLGLDPFEADPAAFARRRGLTAPYVIYSGRRETLKGTPVLTNYLAAFRARTGRDLKAVFTGSGPIEAPDELLPHLLDVGFVSEEEKREAMAGAVAFVHPSVNESLGIVLLEAWLARTPCLVHAKGEVLRDQALRAGGGLWFRSYPEFEAELSMLMDQPDLRRRLGESGRAFVLREYAWPAVEKRMLEAMGR